MSWDYRITVNDGRRRATYELAAGRPALAMSRALDLHQRAHKRERVTTWIVDLVQVGTHQRGPCDATCGARVGAPSGSGVLPCGAPCTGLENHRTLHRCAEHGGAGSYRHA